MPESPNKPLDDLICFDLMQDKNLNPKILKFFGNKAPQIEKSNQKMLERQQLVIQKNGNNILQDQSIKFVNQVNLNSQTLGLPQLDKSNR